jgi:hypothetical protein
MWLMAANVRRCRVSDVTFSLNKVNHQRIRRGVAGVEMDVYVNGVHDDKLWMSCGDVRKNIEVFGECAAFSKALAAYGCK